MNRSVAGITLSAFAHHEFVPWVALGGPGRSPPLEGPLAPTSPPHPRRYGAGLVDPVGNTRILVVDNDRMAADMLAMMLRAMRCNVETCYDGDSAVLVAPTFAPEVVFLDLAMPGMDGFEVANRLREQLGKKIRIVALSGHPRELFTTTLVEAGFDDFLLKPASAEVLSRAIAGKPSS